VSEGASEPPATHLQLEVVAGNAAGTTIEVHERLVFGRQTDGAGQLAEDPELSRHHAQIARRPGGEYQLEDLSSTNGTYVNGQRLEEPATLSLGDTIELGTTKLVVRALLAPPTPEADTEPDTVDVRAATAVTDVPAALRKPAPAEPAPEQPAPEPAATQPAPAPPPPPPPPPPPLDLRLRVDLEHAEAEVALGAGPSVHLRLRDGSWQIVDGDSR
jgi:predicted component of type VI protein secretion system